MANLHKEAEAISEDAQPTGYSGLPSYASLFAEDSFPATQPRSPSPVADHAPSQHSSFPLAAELAVSEVLEPEAALCRGSFQGDA